MKGYKTNHSLRVTCATRLFRSGVDEQIIMNVTGHQSIDGVRTYKRMSDEQYQEVSSILQGSDPKKPKVESPATGEEVPHKENLSPVCAAVVPSKEILSPADGACKSETQMRPRLPLGAPALNISGCSNIVINYNV